MKRNHLMLTAGIFGALLLTACAGGGKAVEKITIRSAGDVTSVVQGETVQLSAELAPEGATGEIVWSSLEPNIVRVDEKGLAMGISVGETLIKAALKDDASIKDEFSLKVTKAPPLLPTTISIKTLDDVKTVDLYGTLQLAVIIEPAEAVKDITWSSSDTKIATVDDKGLVTGMAVGKVVITAASTGKTSIKGTIDLEVVQSTMKTTEDWESMAFFDHAEFASAEGGTPIKVKGKITEVLPEYTDKKGVLHVNYYVQNGLEGYFVTHYKSVLVPVVGDCYILGGFPTNHWGGTPVGIGDVEYFKKITEDIATPVLDLATLADWEAETLLGYCGTLAKVDGVTVDAFEKSVIKTETDAYQPKGYYLPVTLTKADDSKLSLKLFVNTRQMSAEKYAAISDLLLTFIGGGQELDLHGHIASAGFGPVFHNVGLYITDVSAITVKGAA